MEEYFGGKKWELVHTASRPGRERELFEVQDLNLATSTALYVNRRFPGGLYKHQLRALEAVLKGRHACLATGTASGKSAVFYVAALELLNRDPQARVLALYPMKALAREQEDRWKEALATAYLPSWFVCRIDGDVPVGSRIGMLKEAHIVLATPDVCHAWLLPSMGKPQIWNLIHNLALIVVDEVHVYSGVFGSNAAFLFRRLQHAMSIGGRSATYLAASATIRNPEEHLKMLFGQDFEVIGPEMDTSPQYPIDVLMVRPPAGRDVLTSASELARYLATSSPHRFIVFVDSRKQTELISSIVARERVGDDEPGNWSREDDELGGFDAQGSGKRESSNGDASDDVGNISPETDIPEMDHLRALDVLPFRAGYEECDREIIQSRLTSGDLRGIVSTSALELGIDIRDLDVAVLVGVPRSMTSLTQRIGRVGRQRPGKVVIVDGGDAYSDSVFREPETLFDRPLAESALYLENPRIQYIHAMCLAREGGEHDLACVAARRNPRECLLQEGVFWPPGFADLCDDERTGQVPRDLQSMKSDAGDSPHHVFPLRDVESQFEVHMRSKRDIQRKGNLSYGQVMREAYPGAVYYYTTIPYRVTAVYQRTRQVIVRPERRYTTRPRMLPIRVFPNFSEEVFGTRKFGDAILVECPIQVREVVTGVIERRGPTEIIFPYPIASAGVKFNLDQFVRNYFSTGVLLFHPSLPSSESERQILADAAYECFLMQIPFERQDIRAATGVVRTDWGPISEGMPFITFYDQVYGSLRLSGRLLDREVAERVFEKVVDLGSTDSLLRLDEPILACATQIAKDISTGVEMRVVLCEPSYESETSGTRYIAVLAPGSVGVNLSRKNEDFYVDSVFLSPGGLRYRGRHPSDTDTDVTVMVAVENIVPTPGQPMALYDMETGELIVGQH